MVGGGGVTPPYTLSGPTTKKTTFFMCVFPNQRGIRMGPKGENYLYISNGKRDITDENQLFSFFEIFERVTI